MPFLANSQSLVRYDATGHPKAKGLSLVVKHPSDWMASEGERPNIVQKFTKKYSDFNASLVLQVNNVPKEALKEVATFTVNDWREVLSELGSASNISKTQLEGKAAFVGDVILKMERAGMSLTQKQRVLALFHNGKWVWLWCGAIGMPNLNKEQVESRFASIQNQCFLYFNSLVLLDNYSK